MINGRCTVYYFVSYHVRITGLSSKSAMTDWRTALCVYIPLICMWSEPTESVVSHCLPASAQLSQQKVSFHLYFLRLTQLSQQELSFRTLISPPRTLRQQSLLSHTPIRIITTLKHFSPFMRLPTHSPDVSSTGSDRLHVHTHVKGRPQYWFFLLTFGPTFWTNPYIVDNFPIGNTPYF